MKIALTFITIVIVWMCCVITNCAAESERLAADLREKRASNIPKHLIVTTILNRPLMMQKEQNNLSPSTGSERFEGFLVDMLQNLAEILHFSFTISIVKDKKYGVRDSEGKWHGMIGEIVAGDADIAVADLTTTSTRKEAVDFTIPFMMSGIGIIMKKPVPPTLQSLFLMPFSTEVWISGLASFSVISALLFLMARVSSSEWVNVQSPATGSYIRQNNLNFCNSLWFSLGSLTHQGSKVAPRAISTRMLSAAWWIFCFFFVSCYIANLAAILVHQLEASSRGAAIQSVEDLAHQTNVKYGTIAGGSTQAFFRSSQIALYQRMYAFMESTSPSPYVTSYEEGIQKVKQGGYAMFMESASIDYITERDCDVIQVGSLIDYKGYGIALNHSSPMTRQFSLAILKLQDTGTLLALRKKWWDLEEDSCKLQPKKDIRGALTMESLGSLFLLLSLGSIFAFIVGVVELFWKANQTSKEEGGSLCDEAMRELKFGLCGGNMGPSSPNQREGIILQQQDHM